MFITRISSGYLYETWPLGSGSMMDPVTLFGHLTNFGCYMSSMLQTYQFKTWYKGGKSTIENSTNHFCTSVFLCLFVYCIWQFKELDKTLQI